MAPGEYITRGQHFYEETLRLLGDTETASKLTTVQGRLILAYEYGEIRPWNESYLICLTVLLSEGKIK